MGAFSISPNWNRLNRAATLPTKELNSILETEVRDNFSVYQNKFNVFSWMRINKKQKFVLSSIEGSPLVWQSLNSCGWDPSGSLWMNRKELEPCRVKINEENCLDELFDSCFEPLLTYDGRGPLMLDATGQSVWERLTKTLLQNSVLGAMGTYWAGNFFDPNVVKFREDTPDIFQKLFMKSADTCKGVLQLMVAMGKNPKYANMNVEGILKEDDFNGKKYIGSIKDLKDSLADAAPHDLSCVIDEGSISAFDGGAAPVMLVSPSIYRAAMEEYREQCHSLNCVEKRLMLEDCPYQGRIAKVLHVDGIPIIPIRYASIYDKYLTGTTHFAILTVTGNIALGGSFGDIPVLDGSPNQTGIMIQRGNNAYDVGKYYFLAHQLMATAINDANYFVGAVEYAVNQ